MASDGEGGEVGEASPLYPSHLKADEWQASSPALMSLGQIIHTPYQGQLH